VEETQGGPETCVNDFQYQVYPWTGVCAYLEIYNPGIYTFATPCACGTITEEPADINERVCIWQGTRCGGNVVIEPASPEPPFPPPRPPFPPFRVPKPPPPPLPFPPGLAPAPATGLSEGSVAGIVLAGVGCATIMAACTAYAYAARATRAAQRAARAAASVAEPLEEERPGLVLKL